VTKRFKKDIVVPIEAEKVVEAKGAYVWLSITKIEFDKEAERIRQTKDLQEQYTGTGVGGHLKSAGAGNLSVDYTGLSKKGKERRR
ncbi:MAG: hypothetical protein ACTSO7_07365, partial [Candidatus Heimdallarchaeota archaeon]